MRRSVSQLNSYTGCGERYRLERMVRDLPYRPAAWTGVGTAFHEAREGWELGLRKDSLAERFEAQYASVIAGYRDKQPDTKWWIKRPAVKSVEQDIKLYGEHGIKQAEAYEEMCRKSAWRIWTTPDGSPALELGFSIFFEGAAAGFSEGVEVVGFVDLVKEWPSGLLTIEDTKTGNKLQNNRQLGLYALALNETYDINIEKAEYWYTKTGTSGGDVDCRRYTRELLNDQYTALDFGIEHRIFLANPGQHCELCGVRPWCREKGPFLEVP